MTVINKPLKSTQKQLEKIRELVSILVYSREVKEIYTSRMNERNIQQDFGYYSTKGGKHPKDLLHNLDDELQRVYGR